MYAIYSERVKQLVCQKLNMIPYVIKLSEEDEVRDLTWQCIDGLDAFLLKLGAPHTNA